MQGREEREAFARKAVVDLAAAIARDTCEGLGHVRAAWDLTADVDSMMTMTLNEYVQGRAEKAKLMAQGRIVLERWRKVNDAYVRKLDNEA
jgi:hypothetical protein